MDFLEGGASDQMVGKSRVRVGRFTYGKELLTIKHYDQGAALTIGSFCSLAGGITIFLGGEHDHKKLSTYPFGHQFIDELGGDGIAGGSKVMKGDVYIGHDVWIGDGASIMSGIKIGNGAVIAARAHVVKDVHAYEIVGGNPARHIKFRFDETVRAILMELKWWNWPVDMVRKASSALHGAPDVESLKTLLSVYESYRSLDQIA
jgi:acetyltransferase-like isoleucine patch superfamily enzyme